MEFVIKKATRKISKMRIGVFGPSGSGKTYSSLLLAKGLVGGDLSKVVVVDTENGSADLYSHLGDFSTLTLKPPFDPRRYIQAIKECEEAGFEVIITDSISHEWEGVGGCLELADKQAAITKNSFTSWAKITPIHNAFISSIVQSKAHVICCGRAKIDYNFESKKDGGKGKVQKIGLKTVTREGFDYEMTIAFQLEQEHLANIDKDRTGLFNDGIPFLITEETGALIKKWNDGGVKEEIQKEDEYLNTIRKLMSKLTDSFKNKGLVDDLFNELKTTPIEIKSLSPEVKIEIIDILENKVRSQEFFNA